MSRQSVSVCLSGAAIRWFDELAQGSPLLREMARHPLPAPLARCAMTSVVATTRPANFNVPWVWWHGDLGDRQQQRQRLAWECLVDLGKCLFTKQELAHCNRWLGADPGVELGCTAPSVPTRNPTTHLEFNTRRVRYSVHVVAPKPKLMGESSGASVAQQHPQARKNVQCHGARKKKRGCSWWAGRPASCLRASAVALAPRR